MAVLCDCWLTLCKHTPQEKRDLLGMCSTALGMRTFARPALIIL